MKKNIIALSVATVFLGSCASLKSQFAKYERPEANTEGIVRDPINNTAALQNTTDTTNFGDVAWKEVFTDPQLQTLINTALEHNTDLLNAAENVKMAEAQLKAARLAFLPSLSFAPTGTLSKVLTGDYKGDWVSTYSFPIAASWNVDLFGNLTAQKRSAQVALIASQDYQQAVRSGLICGIANCYYTLLMLDKESQVLTDMENLTKDTYEMMKLQKVLRGARETSVITAQAAMLSVQSQQVDVKRQIRETENTLSLLCGMQAQTITRTTLAQQSLPSNFSAGVNMKLLSNRPDIHAAEMSLAQCFYGTQSARANLYPSLTISASGAYTNSLGSIVANPGAFIASLVGSLAQPIFANGKIKAGIKVAEAQYQQALNTWQYDLLSAGSEVSNALVLYNSSNDKAKIDRERVEVLTKSVDYTKELFKMGSSTYLEVITAEQNLLNAELSTVTDDFNKMQAVVNLYSALGGGRN